MTTETKIEGILTHKTPYKERDLICSLLLRSGKTVSVYFYGGRGGGKQNKGSSLELGHMIKVQLAPRRKKLETELLMAKEHQLLWSGKLIRDNFQAFYLCTFFLEFMGKISVDDELEGIEDDHHTGLFNVLSNALFFLNDSLEKGNFDLQTQLFVFLAKISVQLGVPIDTEACLFCAKELNASLCMFDPQNGGFSCHECSSKRDEFLSENKLLRQEYQSSTELKKLIELTYSLPYKDYSLLKQVGQGVTIAQFNYLNLQFGFTKENFKTWSMISAF